MLEQHGCTVHQFGGSQQYFLHPYSAPSMRCMRNGQIPPRNEYVKGNSNRKKTNITNH